MDDRAGGLWRRSAAADGCLSRDERFSAHACAATGSPVGDRGYSFAGRVTVTGATARGQGFSSGARTVGGGDFEAVALSVSSSRSLADHKGFRFVTQSQRAAACFCKGSRSSVWR